MDMDIERLQQLSEKYVLGLATPEEKAILDEWYYSFEGKDIEIPASGEKIKKALRRRLFGHNRRRYLYYAAASVLVLLVAGLLYFQPTEQQTVARAAEHKAVTLPDGTSVWLNAASTVTYPKKFGGVRQVSLSGEAYFDVTHDSLHPFVINAGNVKVTVLGTAFNIKAYAGKPVVVTVTRGKVKVEDSRRHTVFVMPGQQAASMNEQINTSAVKASLFVSWKDGSLDFMDETFEDIALDLERQFDTPVVFREGSLKQLRFTAGFDKGKTIEQVIDMLSKVNQTHWVKDNGTIYITP